MPHAKEKWYVRSLKGVSSLAGWIGSHIFQISAIFVLFAIPIFLLSRRSSLKPQWTLGGLFFFLAVAFFLQHGDKLFDRLKKVGPVELFAQEEVRAILPRVRALVALNAPESMRQESGRLIVVGDGQQPVSTQEFQYIYERAKAIAWTFELMDLGRTRLASDRDVHRLLSQVGAMALMLDHWMVANDVLELLRKISAGSYRPRETLERLSLAKMMLAEETLRDAGQHRSTRFEEARSFTLVGVKQFPDSHHLWFNLAYIQHELGDIDSAETSNRKALKIRSTFAPARYNLAVALVRLRKYTEAYRELSNLTRDHEQVSMTLRDAWDDPELDLLWQQEKWSKYQFFAERIDW